MTQIPKADSAHGGRPFRFVLVGLANTAIDFGVLFALTVLGVNVILANTVSTGAALVFSFFVNRSFTFQAEDGRKASQIVRFLVVTLFGLWVLQPLVLWLIPMLVPQLADAAALLIAKVIATVVTMVWNYLLYSRFVFAAPRGAKG